LPHHKGQITMEIVLHRLSNVVLPSKKVKDADSLYRSRLKNKDDRARGQAILAEAQAHYNAMYSFRKDRDRNKRYNYGDQWGDVICVDGKKMTEEEYIRSQGNVPLKTNLIRRLVKNVMGAYNSESLEPTCIARDRDEQSLAKTMNDLLHYNMELNRMTKMYGAAMEEFLIGGMPVHRKWHGWRNNREDCWTDAVQPNNFIIDSNMRDVRMWDCSFVGEIHDISYEELTEKLVKTPEDYERISEIYKYARDAAPVYTTWEEFGYNRDFVNTDFLIPKDETRCRVIEVWRKESKPRYRCHDWNTGDFYKIEIEDYETMVVAQNAMRMEMAHRNGIPMEEVPFIEAEWFVDAYWYKYLLSPLGDILYEGETEFEHKSHPYVFIAYPFIDGEIHSFVSDVIDQQRYTNRLITLNDWVIRASAKGLLLIPDDCIPKDMSPEEFADTWAKFNGVVVYTPSKTGAVPQQVASNSTNVGIHEMLSLQLKFFEDISGVNAALQGRAGFAGESGQHAQIMAQNAATSLVSLFNRFNEFVREGAYKDVKNIQQFYDEKTIYNIAGNKSEDISKLSDAEFDFSIVQSQNTEIAKANANQFILGLLQQQAISLEQALEVAKDLPYADALLQSIRTQTQQMQDGQVPEGVSPELMQRAQNEAQLRANPQAMAMLNKAVSTQEEKVA